jgi:hypothetical protein
MVCLPVLHRNGTFYQAVEKRSSTALRLSLYCGVQKYVSFLMISRAFHLSIFEQPLYAHRCSDPMGFFIAGCQRGSVMF